ncbi:MAG: alpha-amylase family glycosyl hydrolase, partial [Chitinophagales bacterium]
KKIDEGYFQSLGVNSLWISPVFQNPYNAYQEYPPPHRWFSGYHGYWPISLSQVDTRFGNNLLFKNLIDDAHNNSMSVYLDYVANHIHEQHPLWGSNPEYFSNLILPDGRKNLRLWDEQRLTTWFEPYMPSFDHSQKNVAELCADSAMYWLKEFNLDGFRHDATKHIETEFWRILTQKIKTQLEIPQQRNIYQIGETFGSRELISSYLGSGMLNAQFDFNLYFDARSVFALDEISFERLSASLHETFYYYGWHHVMGNITGNHDMARFISYASGDLKFTENDKEAGWLRKIDVTNPVGYSKLKMLHAFNMTIPGIPIIYYGDEIGIPGANDPDNRRMMRFDSLSTNEQDVKNTVIELSKLRSEHMALLYGDFQELLVNDTIYAYKRSYFSDTVITIFNKSGTSFQYQIPLHTDVNAQNLSVHFDSVVSELQYTINPGTDPGTYHSMSVTVKPYSFEIITFK